MQHSLQYVVSEKFLWSPSSIKGQGIERMFASPNFRQPVDMTTELMT